MDFGVSEQGSTSEKILLIVPQSDVQFIENEIDKIASSGWQDVVLIKRVDENTAIESKKVKITESLISDCLDQSITKIIAQPSKSLKVELFEESDLQFRTCGSARTLVQAVKDELKRLNIHWLAHANNEWNKSSIKHTNPEQWVGQFNKFGQRQIGINLLKCLKVINDSALRQSFVVPAEEHIGLQVLHGFIKDDEFGASSSTIKNILAKMYPSETVVEIDLDNLESLKDSTADIIYVYEDGLWSGVEVVNRLTQICASDFLNKTDIQFHFKYGATSDVGLIAARIFAKREKLHKLQFCAAKRDSHFTFLKNDFNLKSLNQTEQEDKAVRKYLDANISPYAFQNDRIWEDVDEAKSFCFELGKQLAKPFVVRQIELSNANKQKSTDIDLSGKIVEKCELLGLGACQFASTIVFASSIPKPVLPLFWLNGKVKLENQEVDWKPLFWDARRTDLPPI